MSKFVFLFMGMFCIEVVFIVIVGIGVCCCFWRGEIFLLIIFCVRLVINLVWFCEELLLWFFNGIFGVVLGVGCVVCCVFLIGVGGFFFNSLFVFVIEMYLVLLVFLELFEFFNDW